MTVLKQNILYLLTGVCILISFGFICWALAFHEIPEGNRDLFIHLMGIIEGAFLTGLVATFFGSSKKEHDPSSTTRTTQTFEVRESPPDKVE